MKDTLYTGDEVRTKLATGIRKVAEAVGSTMGTGGSNAIIEAMESPGHLATNDGWSIANAVFLADPIENMGKNILLEAINRANKQSGDGSSTTCVLTDAIIHEGQKHVGEVSPMELKRSLEACVPLIEASITTQKREITVDEVGPVAAISAEDEEIGARIQEIYQQIGKDGIIHWDISKTGEDSYTIGTGITIDDATYVSPYMCDADESGRNTNQVRLKNPKILITKQKIASAADLNALLDALYKKEVRDLVVFCDEYEPLLVNDLILTRAKHGFRTILVKMPVLWKDQWYEDLSLASGANIADPAIGKPLKDIKIEDLGTFENILITKTETHIDGVLDLSTHIQALEEEGSDDATLRASRLNTKTARYFVGAPSDSALSYRRLKVEDAISASWQALHGGIVAGGGSALVVASDSNFKGIGAEILHRALCEPAKQIARNCGKPDMVIGMDYRNGMGFDTKNGKFVNMFDAHITDPANVVLNAVKNAISVAATILTANTLVTLPRQEQPQSPNIPVQV